MGDRANIHVKESDEDSGVYPYTHWAGTELPQTLQSALKKKWRWNDCQYLTRIIFDEMTIGNNGNETGFGISAQCGDGDNRILTINVKTQTVTNSNGRTWTFQEFCESDVGWN